MESKDEILISVVIGFKDWGLDRLEGVSKSIISSLSGIPSEVIISDYGSSDNSGFEERLSEMGVVYRYISTNGIWSRSRALNAGLKLARGKYVVTTDADMVFSPSTFPELLNRLESDSNSYYLLQCRDLPKGPTHEDINEGIVDWSQIDFLSKLRPRWGMGGLIAFSADAYHGLRGLDERMEIYGGEDIDLAKRLLRLGLKQVWLDDPRIRMYHVWHPSSRVDANSTEAGRIAIETNRDIHMNDKTIARNLSHWDGRPEGSAPLVTIAISTYNRASYLTECVDSVFGQTVQDWELLIVNDGSTDETSEILDSFDDPRIRVYHRENQGLASARNFITSQARGKYIAVHDDDDIMLPQRLEHCLNAITDGAVGAYGGWIDFDNTTGERTFWKGKKLSLESILFNRATYLHPTLMVERRIMEMVPYDSTMRSGSDFNLGVRMMRAGVKLNHCGHFVLLRRQHEGQITNSDSTLQKVSAVVTNLFARATMSPADIQVMKNDRPKKDWIGTTTEAEAGTKSIHFLPDHLVDREGFLEVDVSGYVSSPGVDLDPVKSNLIRAVQYLKLNELALSQLNRFTSNFLQHLHLSTTLTETSEPNSSEANHQNLSVNRSSTLQTVLINSSKQPGFYLGVEAPLGSLFPQPSSKEVDSTNSEDACDIAIFKFQKLSDATEKIAELRVNPGIEISNHAILVKGEKLCT